MIMYTIRRILTALGCFSTFLAFAADQPIMNPASQSVVDLRIGILPMREDCKLDAEQEIAYEILNAGTNSTVIFQPEDHRYLYRVDLFDANGNPVAKTKLGESVGSRFDELERTVRFKRSAGSLTFFQTSTNEIKTWRIRVDRGASAPVLASPAALFEIHQTGIYKLQLQVQCYKSGTNNLVQLLRFPPVEVPVKKR
jgi:hypothetical protein